MKLVLLVLVAAAGAVVVGLGTTLRWPSAVVFLGAAAWASTAALIGMTIAGDECR